MNIIVSSWPGAGASTLGFFLAKIMKFNLLRASSVFRELGKAMNFADTGSGRIQADDYLEDYFSPLYDKYIGYKLKSQSNLVIETDIIKKEELDPSRFTAVFLTAPYEVRAKRLVFDQRDKDSDLLKERDLNLKTKYQVLYGYDWFSLPDLNKNYDLIIDNSGLTLANELDMVYRVLYQRGYITKERLDELLKVTEQVTGEIMPNTKDEVLTELAQNNQIISGISIVKEMSTLLEGEISGLPLDIRNAVNQIMQFPNSV